MSLAPDDRTVLTHAERLMGVSLESATRIEGGANNRIYRLDGVNGPVLAKYYPPQENDGRDRLGREYSALSFLAANAVPSLPRPLAVDHDHHLALYQWIDGDVITRFDRGDVDALAGFVVQLKILCTAPGATDIADASASCFSVDGAIAQLGARLQRLQHCAEGHEFLRRFLERSLVPAVERQAEAVRERCAKAGFDTATTLEPQQRTLSPSDFGFHNALRQADGTIVFLDFEYFGWDDPAKLTADVMLHPGMNLADDLAGHFRNSMVSAFSGDGGFSFRLKTLYPVYGLIWCTILLNEFLPDTWDRRHAAGHLDIEGARVAQLQKSKRLLERLTA